MKMHFMVDDASEAKLTTTCSGAIAFGVSVMLHRAFWDRRCGGDAADDAADDAATFEKIYPRYEFAELVRLATAAGAWLVKARRRSEPRSEIAINPLPGDMNPAE